MRKKRQEYQGEVYQSGIASLLKFLGMSESTLRRNFLDNMKQVGAVIEWREGRPPRKVLLWLPSRVTHYLELWQAEKYKIEHETL